MLFVLSERPTRSPTVNCGMLLYRESVQSTAEGSAPSHPSRMIRHRSLLLAKSHEGEIWLRQRITILKQNSKRKLNHLVGATSAQAINLGDHRL